MLYQPTNITPSTLNGTGIIDHEQDVTVSWTLGGNPSDMLAGWRIIIMQNDEDSTEVYDSGIQRMPNGSGGYYMYPAWDAPMQQWRRVSWTIPAGSLFLMDYLYEPGYKMRINQVTTVWDPDHRDSAYVEKEIEQISPVYIRTARKPFLTDWNYGDTVTGHTASFYTDFSRAMDYYWEDGEMICPYPSAMFQRALLACDSEANVLYDSGWTNSTSGASISRSGLIDGKTYFVKLALQDTNGFVCDTGWKEFTVSYNYAATTGTLTAYYVTGKPCVFLQISNDAPDIEWVIYRMSDDGESMERACVLQQGQREFYDFGARNNTRYTYHAFRYNVSGAMEHLTSNPIWMRKYFDWAIIEAKLDNAYMDYGAHSFHMPYYHVVRTHIFQGNVESGDITNNAGPEILENFTGYPMVQKNARKALSGKLKAIVGRVKNGRFTDDRKMIDAIFAMAQNTTTKFLRDRKGYLLRIEIGGNIVRRYNDKNAEQSTTVTVPWVEVGTTDDCMIGIWPGDEGYPQDAILRTKTRITDDMESIEWEFGEDYRDGSEISMDGDGYLVQTYEGNGWVPAELEISGGRLVANDEEEAGS